MDVLNNGIDANSLASKNTVENTITEANSNFSLTDDKSVFEYDMLKMYFGDPYKVTDDIVIYQPTIQDIIDYGEMDFWSMVYSLCTNPTGVRLKLWDIGIDWNKMTDFQLFISVIRSMSVDKTRILFGDLDLTKFTPQPIEDDSVKGGYKLVLVNIDDINIQIDELIYQHMVDYLRTMFNIHPKSEKALGKTTKEFIIDEERINLSHEKNNEGNSSVLFPLISSLVNHPGFKYKKNELREVGIVEFMDSVRRIQLYESTIAFMHGMYGGLMDTSKIDIETQTNFMRDIYSNDEEDKKKNEKDKKKKKIKRDDVINIDSFEKV